MMKPSPQIKKIQEMLNKEPEYLEQTEMNNKITEMKNTLLLLLVLLLLLSRFSHVRLCATPQTAARQAPLSLGFSRQEHWSGLPFPSPMHESEKWKWSRSVISDSSQPQGLQPTRLFCPWDFPGKSTGVGCHCLLQKNTLEGIKSKINEAEEQISELKDRMVEITVTEQRKNNEKKWDSPRDFWDNIKCTNINIIGIAEGEKKEKRP